MPRPSKPWFWKRRKSWFCTIRGERIELGTNREEAFQAFHARMTEPSTAEERSSILRLSETDRLRERTNQADRFSVKSR